MLLTQECACDNIKLSLKGETEPSSFPPIIKSSILMLDSMISAQGQYNIFVFPEKPQSLLIFMLVMLLDTIYKGKIKKAYNPDLFEIGEKLKYGNCVVEFNGIETREGKSCIKIKMADDLCVSAPAEMLPLFQRTTTIRRLSSYDKFVCAKRKASKMFEQIEPGDKILAALADFKTHFESSIFYLAPINSTKEQLSECRFNGKSAAEILLIGQADYAGKIKNISSGQLAGIPSIVLVADLYSVRAAVQNNAPIQSLIVDVSNSHTINAQLDVMDDLMHLGVPIVCITDTADSFELQLLIERGFNIWRWDEESITESLYDASSLLSDRKIKHCSKRKVKYITTACNEISDSLKMLYSHRAEIREQSAQMISLFDRLFSATLVALRSISPVSSTEQAAIQINLSDCECVLEREKIFISDDEYKDFKTVVSNLQTIFSTNFTFPKHLAVQEHLTANNYSAAYILVPDNSNCAVQQDYWRKWCCDHDLKTPITVIRLSEYYNIYSAYSCVTIVAGWLNNATMRKILYSFNTEKYVVFMYDYEQRWKNVHTTRWSMALNNSNNVNIVKKSLVTASLDISVNRFHATPAPQLEPVADELDEIDLVLRTNKYRKYVVGTGQHPHETAEVIPVNFVGGYLAFFKTTHKVITATNIINGDDEKIAMKTPSQMKLGDFVVVRESDRDLIKELADTILTNSGKHGLREKAMKWKESFAIECMFSTHEQIYERIKAAGASVTYQTVRGWIVDEDKIAPEKKEDLKYIALITEDSVLLEMIDDVFDAAREVKNAHIQAGKYLSGFLKQKLASALHEYGEIDPFNIWEPITLMLDDIGTVKILKVIDIGTVLVVDAADMNRLIEEK